MLSTKNRYEHREHLFLVDLLEEDSRLSENLFIFVLSGVIRGEARIPTD